MIRKRMQELLAILLVGDGVVGVFQTQRHARLWQRGPQAYREAMQALLERPGMTQLLSVLEGGLGVVGVAPTSTLKHRDTLRMENDMATQAPTRTPPGPKGHFLLGSVPDYARDPIGFLLRTAREYGDVLRIRFLHMPIYVFNHPNDIEQVLVKQAGNFKKSSDYQQGLGFLRNGLLLSEGAFWRRQRRLMAPAFHRERIAAYGTVMGAYAERMAAQWRSGETRDINADMMALTLQIVAKTLFDTEVAAETATIGRALDVVMEHHNKQDHSIVQRLLPPSIPMPMNVRFRRAVGHLDQFIYGIIRERRAGGTDPGDLLSMLLQAQDDGTQMTDQQVRDEALTLIIAGHETTALTLAWTWYLLAQHPAVAEKLAVELDQVLGSRAPTVADMPRLAYTTQIIKEAMRLYPPAWGVGRQVAAECEIGGYRLPVGTELFVIQYIVHRDPRYFPDPETFMPERWTAEFEAGLPRFAYFSFGGGPRICIGNSFAMMEAVLLLATLAQRAHVILVPDQQVKLQPSIMLRPKHGIKMIVAHRERGHRYDTRVA